VLTENSHRLTAARRYFQAQLLKRASTFGFESSGAALLSRMAARHARTDSVEGEQGAESGESVDAMVCSLIGSLIVEGGFVHKLWAPLFRDTGEREADVVHECGEPLRRSDAQSRLFPELSRTLWICPRCGIVADCESHRSFVNLHLVGEHVVLGANSHVWGHGTLFVGGGVESFGRASEESTRVQTIRAGSCQPSLPARARSQIPGLRWMQLVIVSDAEIGVYRVDLPTRVETS
jgi:hypothetical protein